MVNKYEKGIESVELIKVERPTSSLIQPRYFYNIKLEGIDDLLIVETSLPIDDNLVGSRIKYELDSNTNEVSNFVFY